jgi:hypothetical protein
MLSHPFGERHAIGTVFCSAASLGKVAAMPNSRKPISRVWRILQAQAGNTNRIFVTGD